MQAFIDATDSQLADLKRRALGKCLRYREQLLPPGTEPRRAAIGIEIASGATILYVDRGIDYRGASDAVREWVEAGYKKFTTFEDMSSWLRHDLAAAYRQSTPTPLALDRAAIFEHLTHEVRGQDDVIDFLTASVARHVAKRSPRRPLTLFAVGPTGVGKTQTAVTLAGALAQVDDETAFLRLDMSEYQEPHRISQFFGAPPGYLGYGEGTPLVDTLREHPRAIVLFDEIEKAHVDVLRALMNAMDAGRLTASSGKSADREIDCRRALFFFTSNLRAQSILNEVEARGGLCKPNVIDEVCRQQARVAGLAAELIGRVRHFLLFKPLSLDARLDIFALTIRRLAAEYGLRVARTSSSVLMELQRRASHDDYGARPDEYLVDRLLGDCFAAAAGTNPSASVELLGPPFHCKYIEHSDEQVDEMFVERR